MLSLTGLNFFINLLPILSDLIIAIKRRYVRRKINRNANLRKQAVIHAIKEKERQDREEEQKARQIAEA